MRQVIRVLVIDDDEMVRDSISAFLEDEGFKVDSVSIAEEALKMLGSAHYDACITDYTLPGMDGESLILLGHESSPETVFIMHSGTSFNPSDELLKIGFTMQNVLLKPVIRLELLTERIMNLVRNRKVSE